MSRCLAVAALLIMPLGFVSGQDKTTKAVEAIGELNEAYVTAFNEQDAKKIAACFSESSDFTLLTGLLVHGRDKVQAAHASFFQNNPDAKAEGKQESFRMIRPGVVLASGIWKVKGGPSEYPSSGLWFSVVARHEGKWQYEAMRLMIPVK